MHTLMGYTINNNNQFQPRCLIGLGIILNPPNSSSRQWSMKKACSTTQINNRNRQSRQQNQRLKILADMVPNINSTNEKRVKIMKIYDCSNN